ncbi:MAG: ACT domain-containing protein [Chloroflexi bacterium]|nr:ACT domain-containing protein [Chloroflexota bacterium]
MPAGAAVEGAPRTGLWAWIADGEETTLVCAETEAPRDAVIEGGWRALRVHGPLDFSLVGILAELAGVLAQAGVSIYALSTYSTDLVLVKRDALPAVCAALRAAGHVVLE